MFRQFRPEPLSPDNIKKSPKINFPASSKHMSLSPNPLKDSQNFLSTKMIEDISSLKIFDETNDEGKPQNTWNDKIKKYRHLSPSVAESLNLINLKHNSNYEGNTNKKFFSRRNRLGSFSHSRESIQDTTHEHSSKQINSCKLLLNLNYRL